MDEFEKIKIEDYDESGFWEKIKKRAKAAGSELIEKVFVAYYCAKDPYTPQVKSCDI